MGFVIISSSCIVTGFLIQQLGTPPVYLALFLIVLGIGTLLFGLYVIRTIYQPIHTLIGIISEISHGNTHATIPSDLKDRSDEIGELARAFDRTLISLKLALKRTKPEMDTAVEDVQQKMTDQRDEQQSVYDELPLPTLALTPDGTITMTNTAMTELFGYEASQIAGESVEMLHPDTADVKEVVKDALQQVSAGETVEETLPFQRADGETFTAEVHAIPITDDNGTVVRVRSILTDYK